MKINKDYELPPVPPSFKSNNIFDDHIYSELIRNMPNTITAVPGCKYRLPCGKCEMTKEMCTNM